MTDMHFVTISEYSTFNDRWDKSGPLTTFRETLRKTRKTASLEWTNLVIGWFTTNGVSIPTYRDEFSGGFGFDGDLHYYLTGFHLTFHNETDAAMFKLRWMV